MLEVVVVISIIGLLIAILLPAIQAARESSRRNTCRARLRDFGVALHGFEAAHQEFPAALEPIRGSVRSARGDYSPQAHLLPYLDQQPLFRQIDFSRPQHAVYDPGQVITANGDLIRTRVQAFLCPSDERGDGSRPGCNYRMCLGPGPYWGKSSTMPGGGTGPFSGRKAHRPSQFDDGLGNTVAMSERLTGGWDAGAFQPDRDFWYSGISTLVGYVPPLDELVDVCASLTSTTPDFYPYSGSTWLVANYSYTWYNHAASPNSSIPACTEESAGNALNGAPNINGGVFTATSHHRGGVNCLLMDGSVRFMNESVDLGVWRAIATRAGGEIVSVAGF